MVALSLLDVVLSGADGADRSVKVVVEVIQSALNEIRHIERLDESLAPADPSNFDRPTVSLVRECTKIGPDRLRGFSIALTNWNRSKVR